MILCILGLLVAAGAVADAYRRALASAVTGYQSRKGDDRCWRWFAFDARANLRASCQPRRFVTEAMSDDDAASVFPYARRVRRKGAR